MSYLADLEKKYMAARQEIAALRQALADRDARLLELSGNPAVPIEFKLTGKEASMLGVLMSRGLCSKDLLMDQIYSDSFHATGELPELKIIDVFICKLRKKLKAFGIVIDTQWGQGYALTPASKDIIRARAAHSANRSLSLSALPKSHEAA